eukprot:COSAG06_NODE_9028_length_2008_cov_3.432163_2_plen_59_part_00
MYAFFVLAGSGPAAETFSQDSHRSVVRILKGRPPIGIRRATTLAKTVTGQLVKAFDRD